MMKESVIDLHTSPGFFGLHVIMSQRRHLRSVSCAKQPDDRLNADFPIQKAHTQS